jgi:adenylate cyclase class IV
MKEIEIKFKLNGAQILRMFEKLEKIKAGHLGECCQRNKYFKHPKLDCIARIRENIKKGGKKSDIFTGETKYFDTTEYIFTVKYQDESKSSFIKNREEIETPVIPGTSISMLNCLGFEELFLVNKVLRTSFAYSGCVIDIDEDVETETWIGEAKRIHFLGHFLEIEGDVEVIRKILKILGLKEEDAVKESYYELAANWKKEIESARKKSNKRRNSRN